ncbi:polysaccharide biosynthesis tyrosine autokinase [Streptomyces sp. NPDC015661]|uniref:polysaccharide biosynthesis tyrosine autokinase n=1 Tax=Streptomyces sp. NPDC015661 TaxID=3364961 RepID=UPI0036FBBAB2
MPRAVATRSVVNERPRLPLIAMAAFWTLLGGIPAQFGLNGPATVLIFLAAVIALPYATLRRPVLAHTDHPTVLRPSSGVPLPLWLFAGHVIASEIHQRTEAGAQNTLVYVSFVAVIALAAAWTSTESPLRLLRWLRGASVVAAIAYLVTVVLFGPGNGVLYPGRLFGEVVWIGMVGAVPLAERSRRGWLAPCLLVTADILSLSRTSAAVCLVLVLGMVLKGRGRGEFRRAFALATVMAVAAYLLVERFRPLQNRFTQNDKQTFAGVEIGTSGRSWLWETTWASIKEAPWLGHGIGSVERVVGHPHNDYLRLWHDLGLLGLVLWTLAILVIGRRVFRRRRAARNDDDWAIHQAALLAVVGLSLNVATSNLLVYLFVMMPVAVVIGTSLGRSASDPDPRPRHPSSSPPKGRTLDLRGFLKALRLRWLSITALALVGLGAGIAFTSFSTPQYRATSQIFVSARTTSDITELNAGNTFSQARVESYADIITSPRIAELVVQRLNLPMTPAGLAKHISAEVKLGTVLIDITVTDRNPALAARIANTVASEGSSELVKLETPQGETLSPVSIGVTRKAETPTTPISPRPLLNTLVGLFAGLLAGVGLAALRDTLDTTLHTGAAMAEATGLAVLGTIPFDKEAPDKPIAAGPAAHGARAEAFRLVRTNLQFAQVDRKPRVIMVTSPLPSEGKTNTATNLALSLAETGARICLVDADLRNPCIAKTFGLVQGAGLTSVLIGAATALDVMQQFGEQGLSVLTSGPIPPNPGELLASERMREILRDLTEDFDTVVVDSAPLLPVADTVGLAPIVDGTVLVVRARRTPAERVKAAVDTLHSVSAPVLGSVLSMVQLTNSGYGYGYGYGERPAGLEDLLVPPQKAEADALGTPQ